MATALLRAETKEKRVPPSVVLKIPYNRDIQGLNLNKILSTYVNLYSIKDPWFRDAFFKNQPCICWTGAPNIASMVVKAKQC